MSSYLTVGLPFNCKSLRFASKTAEVLPSVSGVYVTLTYYTQDGCEWVKPFTRADGSFVEGHWASKPGQICSLIPTPAPASPQHQSFPIHVGPRGGEYHYSKSGKKVYEHRH